MQIVRYGINGVFATIIHFFAFFVCVEILLFESVGIANFLASFFGMMCSYFGNKHFVFYAHRGGELHFFKFFLLYASFSFFHGMFLFLWSDFFGLNYWFGFMVSVFFRFLLDLQ